MRALGTAVLALVSTVVALLVAEGLARVVAPPAARHPFPAIFQPSLDPAVGYELQPDLDTTAYGQIVRTNSAGFRSPGIPRRKPAGVVRIAALGDSVTFGYGVAGEEAFPQRLEAMLNARCRGPRFEVMNTGVVGYTAVQGLRTLDDRVLDFQPDAVVFTFVSNDAEAPLHADADGFLHWQDANSAHTMARHTQVFRRLPLPFDRWLRSHSMFFNVAEIGYNRLRIRMGDSPPAAWQLSSAPSTEPGLYNEGLSRREVLESYVATYSSDAREAWKQIERDLGDVSTRLRAHEIPFIVAAYDMPGLFLNRILSLKEALGFPLADFAYRFGSREHFIRNYSLAWDLHPNAAAHDLMAEVLYHELLDEELLPDGSACEPAAELRSYAEQHAAHRHAFQQVIDEARRRVRTSTARLPRDEKDVLLRGMPLLHEFQRTVVMLLAPPGLRALAVDVRVPENEDVGPLDRLSLHASVSARDLGAQPVLEKGRTTLRWNLPPDLPTHRLHEITLRVFRDSDAEDRGPLREPARIRIEKVSLEGARA